MKTIVIYGAGKIGRGFVADIFSSCGYKLVFVDSDQQLVKSLNAQGYYTLQNIGTSHQEKKAISEYVCLHSEDPTVAEEIAAAGLMSVSVFPDALPAAAGAIAAAIKMKHAQGNHDPLDVIVCANIAHVRQLLLDEIRSAVPAPLHGFMEKILGVSATIVIRVAVKPSVQMLQQDPLTVLTDGHRGLPIERNFKGQAPDCAMLEYHDSLETQERLKLFTYNMAHAAAAYLGYSLGMNAIAESLDHDDVREIVRGALDEVLSALVKSGDFAEDAKEHYINGVLDKFRNPLLGDTVARVGANPKRKLGQEDRIIGAVRVVRDAGLYPYYLEKIAAYGFLFAQGGDLSAREIREHIHLYGIESAIKTYTGLQEPDLMDGIKRHYLKVDGRFIPEDSQRVAFLKKAYALGFTCEKTHRGCAQATLIAVSQLTGQLNKELFLAASGLSGGMALCGDGACGGYTAGILFTGLNKGRDYDRMLLDGDKGNQYAAYEAAQRLHDRFYACYGSVICKDIHARIFDGEHFILRTKPRRDAFEAAGAHDVKCTTVVALSCAWIAEILLDLKLHTLTRGH